MVFTLTGFTDEALTTFPSQARMASEAGLTHVELRRVGVRPTPILKASPRTVDDAERALAQHGLKVSCIATGIGKAPVDAPLGPQVEAVKRAASLAHRFGTPWVRTFSWHTATPNADRPRVLRQLTTLATTAEAEGVRLVHENEKGVYGDTPTRCLELATECGIRLIFDPANFVQCGVRPAEEAWPLLGKHVSYVHAKDARADTRRVVPVGEGDGQWPALVAALGASGWSGFVSLEPHLGLGGRGGPITPRRWVRALNALRRELATAT